MRQAKLHGLILVNYSRYGTTRLIIHLGKLIYNASSPTSTAIKDDVATQGSIPVQILHDKLPDSNNEAAQFFVTRSPSALCCLFRCTGRASFLQGGGVMTCPPVRP